jgi:hypothetical protein
MPSTHLHPNTKQLIRLVVVAWIAFAMFGSGLPTANASSQTIVFKGTISLKGRWSPIEGVGVFLRELRRGTYTDEKGRFRLVIPPGTYTLIIKAIGYKTHRTKRVLKRNTSETLYLLLDPKQQLETTVVAKKEKATPGQLTLSRKQLRDMPGGLGGDPFRAIQNLPGIARNNGLGGALRIRGASPADTGFLMDGHSLPLLYHFGGGPAIVNDRFIEKIDFFPGGAPAMYGRFTSGLVSVTSRTPGTKGIHGEIFLDIIHAGVYLEAPLGKEWGIALAARRSYVDAFLGLVTPDALAARYWDYQAKITWHRGRHRLSLFVFGSDDLVDYQGRIDGDDLPFLGDDPYFLAMHFGRAILQYTYTTKAIKFDLSASAGFSATRITTPEETGELWEWPIALRANLQFQLHKTTELTLGIDSQWTRHTFDFALPVGEILFFPKPSRNTFTVKGEGEKDLTAPGAYINLRLRPHKAFRFDIGLRADIYHMQERLFWGLNPRFSGRWSFHKQWTLLVSSGLFHRTPDIQQWSEELGNPDIQLQAALQNAAGLEWTPFRALHIRMQLFFNYMFDRISGSGRVIESEGTLKREKYNNEGLGRAYGMELLIQLKPWKGLSGWLAYTLSRAERGSLAQGINRLYGSDQTHILNLLLQYELGHGWKIGARFRLVSGRPHTPIIGGVYDADRDRYQPVYGARDSERLPMFHQLDLRIDKTWTFRTWSLGVYLDLLNVYNAQNTERYRYQYEYSSRYPIPGLPIIPAFGLKGAF